MANQGLFTQGPSVEDLLTQRNKRAFDLQKSLMQSAAQGARDPAKAQAISLLGSTLGRALAGSVGDGKDEQVEKIKADKAAQAAGQEAYFSGLRGTTAQDAFDAAAILQERFPAQAADLIQIGNQRKAVEAEQTKAKTLATQDALAEKVEKEEFQTLAADLSENLKEVAPELYDINTSGRATQATVTQAIQVAEKERQRKLDEAAGTTPTSADIKLIDTGVFTDGKGNRWQVMAQATKGDLTGGKAIYTPIGAAPPYDSKVHGRLEPLNSSNLSVTEQTKLAADKASATEKAKHWVSVKADAGEAISNLKSQESYIRRASELLEKIETGGWEKNIKAVTDFFNITSSDVGEFDVLTAQSALSQLKTVFGGNPTEGERAILFQIQANISVGKGINKRILEAALMQNQWRQEIKKRALKDKTNGDDYYDFLADNEPPQYKVDPANEAAFRRSEENLRRAEQGLALLPEIPVKDNGPVVDESTTDFGEMVNQTTDWGGLK